MSTALSHLKVVDLTSNLSGPYCAMILADQGADVIKVERKGEGDTLRKTPPFVGGAFMRHSISCRRPRPPSRCSCSSPAASARSPK